MLCRLYASNVDAQEAFYSSPESWLDMRYPAPHTNLPTHIVMFDVLVKVHMKQQLISVPAIFPVLLYRKLNLS